MLGFAAAPVREGALKNGVPVGILRLLVFSLTVFRTDLRICEIGTSTR